MKIKSVKFKKLTKEALYCNVTFERKPLFRKPYKFTKEMYIERFPFNNYASIPQYSDTGDFIGGTLWMALDKLMIRSIEENEIVL